MHFHHSIWGLQFNRCILGVKVDPAHQSAIWALSNQYCVETGEYLCVCAAQSIKIRKLFKFSARFNVGFTEQELSVKLLEIELYCIKRHRKEVFIVFFFRLKLFCQLSLTSMFSYDEVFIRPVKNFTKFKTMLYFWN